MAQLVAHDGWICVEHIDYISPGFASGEDLPLRITSRYSTGMRVHEFIWRYGGYGDNPETTALAQLPMHLRSIGHGAYQDDDGIRWVLDPQSKPIHFSKEVVARPKVKPGTEIRWQDNGWIAGWQKYTKTKGWVNI